MKMYTEAAINLYWQEFRNIKEQLKSAVSSYQWAELHSVQVILSLFLEETTHVLTEDLEVGDVVFSHGHSQTNLPSVSEIKTLVFQSFIHSTYSAWQKKQYYQPLVCSYERHLYCLLFMIAMKNMYFYSELHQLITSLDVQSLSCPSSPSGWLPLQDRLLE